MQLHQLYPHYRNTIEEMAEALDRTEEAIRLKASRLGIKRPTPIYGDKYIQALELINQASNTTDDEATKGLLSEALDILDPQHKPMEWSA